MNRVDHALLLTNDEGRETLNGEPYTGLAFEYGVDGSLLSQISYRDGIEHGWLYGWHPNGVKSIERFYLDSQVKGVYREWHPNGQQKLEVFLDINGERVSAREWDEYGNLTMEFGSRS